MEQRQLGATGIRGDADRPRARGARPARVHQRRPRPTTSARTARLEAMEARSHEVLDAAWAAGIRYLDAARSYGYAERFLASWLRARDVDPTDGHGRARSGATGTSASGGWTRRSTRSRTTRSRCSGRSSPESRALLGPWLRLYQVHSATLESGILADAAVLARARAPARGGRARHRAERQRPAPGGRDPRARSRSASTASTRSRCVQATWNVLEPSAGAALAEAHDAGWGVIVKEALANGRLLEDEPRSVAGRRPRASGTGADVVALAAVLAQPVGGRRAVGRGDAGPAALERDGAATPELAAGRDRGGPARGSPSRPTTTGPPGPREPGPDVLRRPPIPPRCGVPCARCIDARVPPGSPPSSAPSSSRARPGDSSPQRPPPDPRTGPPHPRSASAPGRGPLDRRQPRGATRPGRLAALGNPGRVAGLSRAAGMRAAFVRPFGTAGTTAVYRFDEPLGANANATLARLNAIAGRRARGGGPHRHDRRGPERHVREPAVGPARGRGRLAVRHRQRRRLGDRDGCGDGRRGPRHRDPDAHRPRRPDRRRVRLHRGRLERQRRRRPGRRPVRPRRLRVGRPGRRPLLGAPLQLARDARERDRGGDREQRDRRVRRRTRARRSSRSASSGDAAGATRTSRTRSRGRRAAPSSGSRSTRRPRTSSNLSLGSNSQLSRLPPGRAHRARARGARSPSSRRGTAASMPRGTHPRTARACSPSRATDNAGKRGSFGATSSSNYGAIVDIAAPGAGIISTWNGGTTVPGAESYGNGSGTSQAAPHVAAIVAMLRELRPSAQPAALERALTSSATAFAPDATAARLPDGGLRLGDRERARRRSRSSRPRTSPRRSSRSPRRRRPRRARPSPSRSPSTRASAGSPTADLIAGGSAAGCVIGTPSGGGAAWSVSLTGCGDGTVTLTLKAQRVQDSVANVGPDDDATSAAVMVDHTPPASVGADHRDRDERHERLGRPGRRATRRGPGWASVQAFYSTTAALTSPRPAGASSRAPPAGRSPARSRRPTRPTASSPARRTRSATSRRRRAPPTTRSSATPWRRRRR